MAKELAILSCPDPTVLAAAVEMTNDTGTGPTNQGTAKGIGKSFSDYGGKDHPAL
ncbi:hypothetical protein G3A56_20315 [Rhizobium oryzihabitans]|uniref:Uncharacterized protein n=1 Tax=Rhizobium oryzihabitans TaxID=2267833 RepID=A0A7L5BN43_9HYPH|nr:MULTISPECIES: hypothetical protein [Hyphomicrobiales]MCQ9148333.1 hypothetical protein [Ochrobactrum sp. BTU2]QIB40241.1 hypothetical protein G3A56_20315 [Rhizobium oryzihabitans]